MIRSKIRFRHDFHLIFLLDLELLVDVIIQKIADDDWDELHSFRWSWQLLDDLLQQFRLLFENLNLEFDDLLGLLDGEIFSSDNLFLDLLSDRCLEHVDLLVVSFLHEDNHGFLEVFKLNVQDF